AGTGNPGNPAAARGGEGDDEGGEEPVAQHHHGEDAVILREIARDPVLEREDEGGEDHQGDPEPVVVLLHAGLAARVMWRLRPKPGARVTTRPAPARARRTFPAAE